MHADQYLREVADIAEKINREEVEELAWELNEVRERRGRVYVVGLGGSYANAEHAACDLRKLCEIEAYAPNTSEMSAWLNDEVAYFGLAGHLRWMTGMDALLVLSVGGGAPSVSYPLVGAIDAAKEVGASIYGIVGPNGGHTAEFGDVVIKVPAAGARVTPHTEAFQAVLWHLLVSHPILQRKPTKW